MGKGAGLEADPGHCCDNSALVHGHHTLSGHAKVQLQTIDQYSQSKPVCNQTSPHATNVKCKWTHHSFYEKPVVSNALYDNSLKSSSIYTLFLVYYVVNMISCTCQEGTVSRVDFQKEAQCQPSCEAHVTYRHTWAVSSVYSLKFYLTFKYSI